MAYKGIFKCKNPQKYKGNPTNIVYRSSWELKYMMKLDHDPKVISWASEENPIPYKSPVDGDYHRYFVDFWVKKAEGEFLIEIKPQSQSIPPNRTGKTQKRFLKEVATYLTNQAKWDAAKKYCANRRWQFVVLTENELGIKK